MAKLYFYYSAMNAGKTTSLLQSSYNYQERGMDTLLYTAAVSLKSDNKNKIYSRIGLTAVANFFYDKTNLFEEISVINRKKIVHCILIDECHFLSKNQVLDLTRVVDTLNIPVLCYGLRTDFQAELFSGSLWLLAWADKLIELKTICYCGRKANRVLRVDNQGIVIKSGNQVMAGNNRFYISVCRKHFTEKLQSEIPIYNIQNKKIILDQVKSE